MLDRARIAALIPHQGAMCLLEEVVSWDRAAIDCRSRSHLDPANPLRHDGRLAALAGIEYGLQAAALHGALAADRPQPRGFLAALSGVRIAADRLDRPALGPLAVTARLELRAATGLVYAFRLAADDATILLEGRASIVFPP